MNTDKPAPVTADAKKPNIPLKNPPINAKHIAYHVILFGRSPIQNQPIEVAKNGVMERMSSAEATEV